MDRKIIKAEDGQEKTRLRVEAEITYEEYCNLKRIAKSKGIYFSIFASSVFAKAITATIEEQKSINPFVLGSVNGRRPSEEEDELPDGEI